MANPINRVARSKEAMLASAIQKAASLAQVSDAPRQQILVKQLKAHGIQPQFANIATQAFNKRCTINFIKAHSDETRDGQFPLADPMRVIAQMTGQLVKQAFLQQSFIFQISPLQQMMSKTASSIIDVTPIQEDSYAQKYTDQVRAMLDKCLNKVAAYVAQYKPQLDNFKRIHQVQVAKFANQLAMSKNAAYITQSLIARYGSVVSQMLQGLVPQDADLTKRASNILCVDKALDTKCRALLVADAARVMMQHKFAKFASHMQQNMRLYSQMYQAISNSQIQQGITKMAAAVLTAATVPILSTAGLGMMAAQQAQDKLVSALLAIKKQKQEAAPSSFISTQFLLRDSDMQQRMALADILADSALSAYDPQDIQDAFVHALQADKSLQKPSRRQLLKATMRIRMAQNDKVSPADLAALYSTLGSIPGAQKTTAQVADKIIRQNQSKPGQDSRDAANITSLISGKPLVTDALISNIASMADKAVGDKNPKKSK